MTDDPFGTAQIRQRVLQAWAASPARFREDANAEEDLVLGGYRDRLLVELAQNATDAASAAGLPGHLRLTLDGDVLRAANVGVPLDRQGVQGLATLRASAKRGRESIGRFGVGFAAVLAVSDEPSIVSCVGGVRFSAADTHAAAAELPALAAELGRRGADRGSVPVLRLPFPVTATTISPPPGFDTEVVLPLRPRVHAVVRALLDGLRAEVLLGLPGLGVLDIDGRILRRDEDGADVLLHDGGDTQRWRVSSASGTIPLEYLSDRPIEERERPQWTLTWAVPVEAGRPQPLPGRQVVHAPTPSDEPLSLPLRLIASYPMAPDRRHIAPGKVSDHLTAMAARAFGDLVTDLSDDPSVLALLPRMGLAASELDAALGRAITSRLRGLAWLPDTQGAALPTRLASGRQDSSSQPADRVRPDRATALDPSSEDLVAALGDVVTGLLPAPWSRRTNAPVLTALGVRRLGLAEVVELLSGIDRRPSWWGDLYAALERTPSHEDRDALSAIPIPLTDGRTALGARGLQLPDRDLGIPDLGPLGLRLVHPDAFRTGDARRLLERLGASPVTAAGVLAAPVVRAAVEASCDEDDPAPIAQAVLALVRAAASSVGAHPWLADLTLRDSEGEWAPAGELLLSGSALASVLEPDTLAAVDPALVATYGVDTLIAIGVLDHFAIVRDDEHELGERDHDLDAEYGWYEAVFDRLPPTVTPPVLTGLVAVRDLELVREDSWPAALRLLTELGADVFTDAVIDIGAGESIPAPSYTRWWLSTHPVLDGRRPDRLRGPGSDELAGLFDVADGAPPLLSVMGCLSTVQDALADPETALELLHRLGQPDRSVRDDVLSDVYRRLAVALEGIEADPPRRVRVGPSMTVDRDEAVILDAPYLLPLLDRRPVPAAGAAREVAELLDVPLATDLVTAHPTSKPASSIEWAQLPGASAAARRLGVAALAGHVAVHHPLLVTGGRAAAWWPYGETDHVDAAAGPQALGRALAWRYDRWPLRAALAETLAHPDDAARLRAEDAAG